MESKKDEKVVKRPYIKPKIEEVRFDTDVVFLAGCKWTNSGPGSGTNKCTAGARRCQYTLGS